MLHFRGTEANRPGASLVANDCNKFPWIYSGSRNLPATPRNKAAATRRPGSWVWGGRWWPAAALRKPWQFLVDYKRARDYNMRMPRGRKPSFTDHLTVQAVAAAVRAPGRRRTHAADSA